MWRVMVADNRVVIVEDLCTEGLSVGSACCMQQRAWPQRQETWLQPPFFSTGLPHLGHGFVLAVIQFLFSLSPWILLSQSRHLAWGHIALNACSHITWDDTADTHHSLEETCSTEHVDLNR